MNEQMALPQKVGMMTTLQYIHHYYNQRIMIRLTAQPTQLIRIINQILIQKTLSKMTMMRSSDVLRKQYLYFQTTSTHLSEMSPDIHFKTSVKRGIFTSQSIGQSQYKLGLELHSKRQGYKFSVKSISKPISSKEFKRPIGWCYMIFYTRATH